MSITIPKFDPIESLIQYKYPSPFHLKFTEGRTITREMSEQWKNDTEEYRAELEKKTKKQIDTLYKKEHKKAQEKARIEAEKKEANRFYNQPAANADFDFWSKAKHWTLDEAIALSFGKEPTIVNWNTISSYEKESPFVAKYARVRNLAMRAIPWKEMFDPVLTGLFIGWARRLDIDFPKELEEKVIARGGKVADWKSNYDALEERYNVLDKAYDKLNKLYDRQTKTLNDFSLLTDKQSETIKFLKSQIAALKAEMHQPENAPQSQKEKGLKTRERDTLLKLVIGMAIDAYGYTPEATRSPAAKSIASDLRTRGIFIDEDTVRKWLNEAKNSVEIVPE